MGEVRQTLRIVVRSPNGKKESTTDVRGAHSHRIVKKRGRALQVAFDDTNRFSHIDCKACNANPWWPRSGNPPTSQYEIELVGSNLWRIRCRKCGYEEESG
jgi:predicted nucleic-acid-binding Zn-ribbon protein